MATTTPGQLTESAGPVTVGSTVIPYVRENQTEMVARSLRPDKPAYFFIDTLNVNQFVQRCSELNIKTTSTTSNDVTVHLQGDGIYCNTTHAYATVVGTSQTQNNTIYLNENYITLNVRQVGTNTSYTSGNTQDYLPGDIIYQVAYPLGIGYFYNVDVTGSAITNDPLQVTTVFAPEATRSFIGKVKYWNPVDAALVVECLSGTATSNASAYTTVNANTVIYKMSEDRIAYVEGIPQGDKFPADDTYWNVTQNIKITGNTSNTHIHHSGQVIRANTSDNFGNTVILSANASTSDVGSYLYISAGTGIGSYGQILSISEDKKTVYLNYSLPYLAGDSRYTIGFPRVDENGTLCSILHIPELAEYNILTGTRSIIITDTPTVNDPTGSMRAMAYYKASSGSIYDTTVAASPFLLTAPVLNPSFAPVKPADPSTRGSTTPPLVLEASSSYGSGTYMADSDPLAQTFWTPKTKSLKQNYGIFVSSIDLWFKNKPIGESPKFPVIVKITETNNGYPTSTILGSSVVEYSNIIVSNVPDGTVTEGVTNPTATKFTFTDPIYLQPDKEYAIVVVTESPDYQLFISDIGSYDISYAGSSTSLLVGGSTVTNLLYTYLTVDEAFAISDALLFNSEVKAASIAGNTILRDALVQDILSAYRANNPTSAAAAVNPNVVYYAVDPASGNAYQMSNLTTINAQSKVSTPPSVGSFFIAQNSSTWVSLKNQKMMFAVNKARFSTNPVIVKFNVNPKQIITPIDRFILNVDDFKFGTSKISYGLYTTYYDKNSSQFVKGSIPTYISPKQQLNFGQDLKVSSTNETRQKYVMAGNSSSMQLEVTMQTADPDISPIFNAERLACIVESNLIDNAGITDEDVAVLNSEDLTGMDLNDITVTIDAPYLATGTQATANVMLKNRGSDGQLMSLNITNPGSGYIKTPNITIVNSTTSAVVANVAIAGENKKYGGNALCRYQTRKIILADGFDAGDMRVWVDGIIPQGTAVYAYYKVQSAQDSDDFINKTWQLMELVKHYKSPDQATAIELQFAPSLLNEQPAGVLSYTENDISYPLGGKFKYFAVKLIMTAEDPTVYPKLLNMRIVALPSG